MDQIKRLLENVNWKQILWLVLAAAAVFAKPSIAFWISSRLERPTALCKTRDRAACQGPSG